MGILLSERFQRGRRFSRYVDLRRTQGGGRGAHMYVPPQRVWFWGHSGLEWEWFSRELRKRVNVKKKNRLIAG